VTGDPGVPAFHLVIPSLPGFGFSGPTRGPGWDRYRTARAWAERTPAGFTFNIKAFSLFTQHPTPVRALPADLRDAAAQAGKDRVYLKDVGPAVAEAGRRTGAVLRGAE